MIKKTANKVVKTTTKKIPLKILITQPKPEGAKSPYYDLALKHGLNLDFQPFIKVEGIPSKDFRKQKIDLASFSAVIFTSRNAIDHFFRICDEMKIHVSQDTKYFCITESVALYLQKFILYRKRKVFYGADGHNKSLFDVINKHKINERFLYPCSESFDSEITKNYMHEFHPECYMHNYDEITKLCHVVRDSDGIIIDPLHKTVPYLTKFEKARVLGQRAKQIESGAKPFVNIPETIIDGHIISELELKEKKIPFIIRRPIPGGGCEYWYLRDLEIINL